MKISKVGPERRIAFIALVNDALYQYDPIRSGCKENDAYDEYESISATIVNAITDKGLTVSDAVYRAFSVWGLSDFLDSESIVQSIIAVTKIAHNIEMLRQPDR